MCSGALYLLTQGIICHIRGSGPEDSDALCVPLRDVHGELVAVWELGGPFGPQHHDRHVLQICTSTQSQIKVVVQIICCETVLSVLFYFNPFTPASEILNFL